MATQSRLSLAQVSYLLFIALMGVHELSIPWSLGGQWSDLALFVSGVAIALSQISERPKLQWPSRPTLLAALYFILAFASCFYWSAELARYLALAELLSIFLITQFLNKDPNFKSLVFRVWIFSAAFLAALALVGTIITSLGYDTIFSASTGGMFGWPWRPKGLCWGPDMLASVCLVPCILVYSAPKYLAKMNGRRSGLLALFVTTILLTLSRTLLALGVSWTLLKPRMSNKARVLGFFITLMLLVFSVRFDWVRPGRVPYFSTQPGLRWQIGAQALHNIAEHPWLGIGPDASVSTIHDYQFPGEESFWDAHCTALQIAAIYGLPALMTFGLFVVLSIRAGSGRFRESRPHQVLLVAVLALIFDSLSMDIQNFRHFWVVMALLISESTERTRLNGELL